jgi:hypothetical protein
MQQPQEQECVICGNPIKNHQQVEIIDNKEENKVFDSVDCALMFKRFESIYGNDYNDLFPLSENRMT